MTTDLMQDLKDSIVLESERIVARCRELRNENDRLRAQVADLEERLEIASRPMMSPYGPDRQPWTFGFTDEQLPIVMEAIGDCHGDERDSDALAEFCRRNLEARSADA